MLRKKQKNTKVLDINYNDNFLCSTISNKSQLLMTIISKVPDDSVWYVNGIYSEDIEAFLCKYSIQIDYKMVIPGLKIWPKQKEYFILLNEKSKNEIIKSIDKFDFDDNFVHQVIYKNNDIYFCSFDCMSETATWSYL